MNQPSWRCQKCGEHIGWLGRLLKFTHKCKREATTRSWWRIKGNIMGNEKKTPVTIDGVEYKYEDMTQQQQMLLNHVADLDRKLDSARFNVDQLQVGRDAFFTMLKTALEAKPEEAVTDVTVN